ncbi:MAG: bifunctional phosphoribosyl-AMP cyclohydrolase/phosphoribosyl-ATP diphosphatase HisIE [Dehalococcoidia bacterium]|nr:bifunctional phosphoribosyl-AMP cyclohydrolase/phosphoribosyl-ATP diphosphatase HisIE [Dehalococcoidia bacterium]
MNKAAVTSIKLNAQGLIPAIAWDEQSGKVLMLGWMDREAIKRTLESGDAWFYSRSRQELWHKGATSGNYIRVKDVQIDCDGDVLLLRSAPTGPACHTGEQTCFFTGLHPSNLQFEQAEPHALDDLFTTIESRRRDRPEGSYVAKLLSQGTDRIGKKVIEEAGETVIAAKNNVKDELVHEVADLWFHSLILLSSAGLTPEDIYTELRSRRK